MVGVGLCVNVCLGSERAAFSIVSCWARRFVRVVVTAGRRQNEIENLCLQIFVVVALLSA